MMPHPCSPTEFHRLVLSTVIILLMLHSCANADPVLAGSQCSISSGSSSDNCTEGLVCLPESPGSVINICKVAEGCQLFGCRVEHNECVCGIAADCTSAATRYNFTSLEQCQEFIPDSKRLPCEANRCPRVWCYTDLQYIPEGSCCPVCPPLPSIHTPSSPGCTENSVHYEEGESWQRDACVTCTCVAGLPLCASVQCQVPDCEHMIMIPGQCCPLCASTVTVHLECEYDGNTYQDGDWWNRNGDPCITCNCANGEILCSSPQCLVHCDNAMYIPNTCCPVCPGDDGYPSGKPSTTSHSTEPTPPNTQPLLISTTIYTTLPSIPHQDIATSDSASVPTTGQAATTTQSENSPATCKDDNGDEQADGASWCPTPHMKATCHSGTVFYTEHHCPTVTCQDPAWTAESCNCPVCPEWVTVSALLEMDYGQYLKEEEMATSRLQLALTAVGLKIMDIHAVKYGHDQTQVTISVTSSSGDDRLLEQEALQTLLDQLQLPLITSLKVEHHEEPKSKTKNLKVQPSAQTHAQEQATAIIAATVSLAIAVACVVIIAVILMRLRKINPHKTVTV